MTEEWQLRMLLPLILLLIDHVTASCKNATEQARYYAAHRVAGLPVR